MAITANKKFWTEFIDIYRTLPCLWNTRDENYNNRESRSEAWNKLVKKLQEVEPDANQDSVKRKINTFRSNFNREVRKIRQTQKEQPSEEYNPTLWYFDHLSFLLNQEKYHNSSAMSTIDETYNGDMTLMSLAVTKCEILEDNKTLQAESTNQEEIANRVQNLHYENPLMINKQKPVTEIENLIEYSPLAETEGKQLCNETNNNTSIQAQDNSLKNNIKLENTSKRIKLFSGLNKRNRTRLRFQEPYNRAHLRDVCSIMDEADLFGQTWACEFRKLTPEQKLFAKKAIDEILVLGQLNVLKLQTVPMNKSLSEMENDED
ncbi:hypothetical protein DOY81_007303 [Sarcophaga bullata]|nr:hypothetical protein DOY81_007303 [Sarcophaga bullata]